MNLLELRYFLAATRLQNIHRASRELRVSPGAVSKAIGRLEDELGVRLLAHEGRSIRITPTGALLAERAAELLRLEEVARLDIMGRRGKMHVTLAGPEVLLLRYGRPIAQRIAAEFPGASVEFISHSEAKALALVEAGDAHLAVVTGPAAAKLAVTTLARAACRVAVGPGHPLHGAAKAGKPVAASLLGGHVFACPSLAFFGEVPQPRALDGWDEDLAPRRVAYLSSCLKMIEEYVMAGEALAYLPEAHIAAIGAAALKTTGLKFKHAFEVRLVARRPDRQPWLAGLFGGRV